MFLKQERLLIRQMMKVLFNVSVKMSEILSVELRVFLIRARLLSERLGIPVRRCPNLMNFIIRIWRERLLMKIKKISKN